MICDADFLYQRSVRDEPLSGPERGWGVNIDPKCSKARRADGVGRADYADSLIPTFGWKVPGCDCGAWIQCMATIRREC